MKQMKRKTAKGCLNLAQEEQLQLKALLDKVIIKTEV